VCIAAGIAAVSGGMRGLASRELLLIKSASSVGAGHSSNNKPIEDDLSVGVWDCFPRCFSEVHVNSEQD
jgi:hypothetical protein